MNEETHDKELPPELLRIADALRSARRPRPPAVAVLLRDLPERRVRPRIRLRLLSELAVPLLIGFAVCAAFRLPPSSSAARWTESITRGGELVAKGLVDRLGLQRVEEAR